MPHDEPSSESVFELRIATYECDRDVLDERVRSLAQPGGAPAAIALAVATAAGRPRAASDRGVRRSALQGIWTKGPKDRFGKECGCWRSRTRRVSVRDLVGGALVRLVQEDTPRVNT